MLKVSGHRLDEGHNQIIRKWARKWKMKEGPALRAMIEKFDLGND